MRIHTKTGVSAYLSFFRIRFLNGLQYRTAAYAGMATQFAWGALRILMFRAFYEGDPGAFPMEFSALSAYIWLEQAFLTLFNTWTFDNDIFAMIRDGNIAYELTRPLDLYGLWFVKNLSLRLSRALLRCAPILLVAAVLPAPYGILLPANPVRFLVFLLTMALGTLMVVSFVMLVYVLCIRALNPMGIRMMAVSLTEVITGSVIPLPFFPEAVRRVIEWTPFGYMMNLPLRAYSGDIAGVELLRGVGIQAAWLVIMILLGRILMKRALKNVIIQGG